MGSSLAQLTAGAAEVFKKIHSLWGGGRKEEKKKRRKRKTRKKKKRKKRSWQSKVYKKRILHLRKPEPAPPSPPAEFAKQAAGEAVSLPGCGNCRGIRNKEHTNAGINKEAGKGVSSWSTTALENLAQLTQIRRTAAIFRL